MRRIERIACLIKQELAKIFIESKDPRIEGLTVLGVELSADLSYAKVYVSSYLQDDGFLLYLKQAKGYIRHLLGKRLYLRKIPKLDFVYDKTIQDSIRLSKLECDDSIQ